MILLPLFVATRVVQGMEGATTSVEVGFVAPRSGYLVRAVASDYVIAMREDVV